MTPLFAVFEGLDGCGKSTQAKLLYKHLLKLKKNTVLTSEQTNDSIGKYIRHHLNAPYINQRWLQLLFAADRARHLKNVIMPALSKGQIVISDRYKLSSIAYGSPYAKTSWLEVINSKFPSPDITFLIDIRVDECLRRIKKRRSVELFKKKKDIEQVRKNYLKHSKRKGVILINGNQTKKEVFNNIKSQIEQLL